MGYTIEKNSKNLSDLFIKDQSDPFFSYEFLNSLEKNNCLDEDSGWSANYFHHKNNSFIPFYEKNNSQGEFVFDYSWANAFHNHGRHYYPKLVMSIPFTPVEGNRIYADDDDKAIEALQDLRKFSDENNYSSLHALFVGQEQRNIFKELDFIERLDCNYVWQNKNYLSFDDFLNSLTSRHRKNIKKERDYIKKLNIEFQVIENITNEDWNDFYLFYSITYAVRGQRPYLTSAFFKDLKSLKPIILFAHKGGQRIAAALFFQKNTKLYGRYWGARENINFLHFEACYYQGIELAIKRECLTFDPGIQGHHKLKRGFEPVINTSYHWIAEKAFRDAIGDFCAKEAQHIHSYFEDSKKYLPYKHG